MQGLPEVIDETFDGFELGFIGHLLTFFDVVAQVEIGALELPDLLYLPQNAVSPITGLGYCGVVKGIDRRNTGFDNINDADHAQASWLWVLGPIPKFN
jgi:hypothetical protein